jgi:putative transposase
VDFFTVPTLTCKVLFVLVILAHEQRRVVHFNITEHPTVRSPWQHPYVEKLIGNIRCEVLDQVIILNEQHLQRILASYFTYDQRWRTHLSLAMDCPEPRPFSPPGQGKVIAVPEVGGLHHHYERRAA